MASSDQIPPRGHGAAGLELLSLAEYPPFLKPGGVNAAAGDDRLPNTCSPLARRAGLLRADTMVVHGRPSNINLAGLDQFHNWSRP